MSEDMTRNTAETGPGDADNMRSGPQGRHSALLIWSCALAITAVSLLVSAGMVFKRPDDQWLIYAALLPAVGAVACSRIMLRLLGVAGRETPSATVARCVFGIGLICVAAVPLMINFHKARCKALSRMCIANMSSILGAISQGMIEEPGLARYWTNSADILFLENPKEFCCPLAPGVPYSINPHGIRGPNVVCPEWLRNPAKYSSHSLDSDTPWEEQICRMNMDVVAGDTTDIAASRDPRCPCASNAPYVVIDGVPYCPAQLKEPLLYNGHRCWTP